MNPYVSGFSLNTKETLNTDKQEESGGLVVTKGILILILFFSS